MTRHRALSPLITLLAIATGITLFVTGWMLASPAVADPRPTATEQVVRDFYAAVNQGIRTGDVSSLDYVLLEDVEIHGALATLAPGRAGLARYLSSLHAITPQLELSVADIVSTGDRSLVDLAIEGADEGSFLGNPISGFAFWGRVDAVRVRDQRVVEYWSGSNGMAMLETLARAPVAESAVERGVALDRLTIPSDESFVAEGADESRWLYVETGGVTISTMHSAVSPAGESLEPDLAKTLLVAGDLISVPTWRRTEIRNRGQEPARLLVLAVGLATRDTPVMDPAYPQGQPTTSDGLRLPSWWAGVQEAGDGEAMVTSFTGNVNTTLPAYPGNVTVARATLASGAVLSISEAEGPYLVVVNSGTLDLISGVVPAQTFPETSNNRDPGPHGIGAGMLLHAGTDASLRNLGAEPVEITIVSILPANE